MRKKINLILGALIALLCGCKSQKDIPMQSDRIMVLYGPPAYFQQQTKQQQETQQQTTPQQEAPQEAPQKD
ncbi:MAG: hypothetical protein J6C57_00690 [Paludibacteraceae bacterium]|nr:hypothetical protein [Paludibacteraceae bacterium]MBO5012539.1 hypothetical protein [Paludibacteraceae bacterium]